MTTQAELYKRRDVAEVFRRHHFGEPDAKGDRHCTPECGYVARTPNGQDASVAWQAWMHIAEQLEPLIAEREETAGKRSVAQYVLQTSGQLREKLKEAWDAGAVTREQTPPDTSVKDLNPYNVAPPFAGGIVR